VLYKDRSTVSTRPTPKGLLAINPFSEMFGIQHLCRKPLKEFYQGEYREGERERIGGEREREGRGEREDRERTGRERTGKEGGK
jgi:hypothetical protein